MSDVKALHPALTALRRDEWKLMRDAMDGEAAIKYEGQLYLPMPGGFKSAADEGAALYNSYKFRAMFPDVLKPSVAAMIGIAHGREIKIEMPDALAFLWENADGNGLPLEAFHRRITRELLVIGSYGVLADAPDGGGDPYMIGFRRDAIINWDTDWWVLDEKSFVRDGFVWRELERYRILTLGALGYEQGLFEAPEYVFRDVSIRGIGGAVLPRIPFVVGTAIDLSPRIESPPLIGVARAALAIYQLSADYRWQLYMSGQETLVAINGPGPDVLGAGVIHEMMGAEGVTPDLKYVTPQCTGIEAHKVAIEEQRIAAVQAGARLLEQPSGQESGTARALRFASETATLTSVVQNSCSLLERALRNIAMLLGMSEAEQETIVVHAPTDLLDRTMTPADAEAMMRVWQGGGISYDTFYANIQRGGIASAERTADEEFALIDGQGDTGGLTA